MDTKAPQGPLRLSDGQIAQIGSKKIFFGHHSVGNNVLDGVRDLMAKDGRLKLKIVKSSTPQTVPGPALVESEIGENGRPESKDHEFLAILGQGMGATGGIAMYKYCYVDVDAQTEIAHLFSSYRETIQSVKARYPSLTIVHITMPLKTSEPRFKAWVKKLLGRGTARELNVKRNQFNRLLRDTYAGVDPIFDLAEMESTQTDGSRVYFTQQGEKVYTLAPEFTDDGGHLNERGRRAAAEKFLLVLSTT